MNPKAQCRDFSGLMYIVEKTAMDKQAVLPLIALAPLAMKLLMGAATVSGGYGAVQAARKGDWLSAGGNALMALPGIGWLGRGMKGLQLAGQGIKGTALASKLAPAAATVAGKPGLFSGLSKFWGGLKPVQGYRAGRDALALHEANMYGSLGGTRAMTSLTGSKAYGAVADATNRVGNMVGGFVPQMVGTGMTMGSGGMPSQMPERPPMQMEHAQNSDMFGGLKRMVGPLFEPQPYPTMDPYAGRNPV